MSNQLVSIRAKYLDNFLKQKSSFFVNTQTNIKIKGSSRTVSSIRLFLLLLIVSLFIAMQLAFAQEKQVSLGEFVARYEETDFEFVPVLDESILTNISSAGNIVELPSGEYQAVFRLKISDNTMKKEVASVSIVAGNDEVAFHETIYPQDFDQVGIFQEFVFNFEQIWDYAPEFSISYLGGSDLFLDKVEIYEIMPKENKES